MRFSGRRRLFCPGGTRPRTETLVSFIDAHRQQHGVESICRELEIAPSTYYQWLAKRRDPSLLSARAQNDAVVAADIERVWISSFGNYGARKVWHQLKREGKDLARCTVERLMRKLGLQGVRRGKAVKTTVWNRADHVPDDKVNREFHATRPNQLWVADFTYVSTWRGMMYVAFVIDVFASCIVGWKVSKSPNTDLVLDALEQAIHCRLDNHADDIIHHSDRGVQYLSIRYTDRLKDEGIELSVGSVGDSYDNALAESIIGLFKSEVIHKKPWKGFEELELATCVWVDWFNNGRIYEKFRYNTPAETEAEYHQQQTESLLPLAA